VKVEGPHESDMDHHPLEKAKITGLSADDVVSVTIDQLEDNLLADVFGWLSVEEIMGKRCVCNKWKEAAKKTIVPPTDFFRVNSKEKYNAMTVMTRAMPNLQQIWIGYLGYFHKYNDGEDPDEGWAAIFAGHSSHDIGIISNFSRLKDLKLWNTLLNGRYPFLFNSFPLLQKLDISQCDYLKWDLEMLAGMPLLKELECCSNKGVTGNINSLRVLKNTLEKVRIVSCPRVEGNFMDLADFPHLKEMNLERTAVIGDIRDIIDENDFSSLEHLNLPESVYGGAGCEFQRISDGTALIRAVCLLKKQRPALIMDSLFHPNWYVVLSEDSPDSYEEPPDRLSPPFCIHIVQAGSRLGYQWYATLGNTCEVNWLDAEPDRESSDYRKYIEELQAIELFVEFYRGFHQPPTEEEYRRLLDERHGG